MYFRLIEKLFDIARRVPFLAMTIIEKNHFDSPWLFRTKPLQTNTNQSISEIPLQLAQPPTPVPIPIQHQKHTSSIQITPIQIQQEQQRQAARARVPTAPIPIDPKKVTKSSTAPNLPTSNSLSEMFRVI